MCPVSGLGSKFPTGTGSGTATLLTGSVNLARLIYCSPSVSPSAKGDPTGLF